MEPAQTPTIPSGAKSPALSHSIRAFLDRPRFASLATVEPDGAPRQAVIWYRLEEDGRILLNSRAGRRWPTNLLRDRRVSLAIGDPADGYSWVGLTGRVVDVTDEHDAALADIVALAWRYHPEGPAPADLESFRAYPRITFRVAIDGIYDHRED